MDSNPEKRSIEKKLVEKLINTLMFNDSNEAVYALLDAIQIRKIVPLVELQAWFKSESKNVPIRVDLLEKVLTKAGVNSLESKRMSLRVSDLAERQSKALFTELYSVEPDYFGLARELLEGCNALGAQLDLIPINLAELIWELIESELVKVDTSSNRQNLKTLCKGDFSLSYALIASMQSSITFESGKNLVLQDFCRKIFEIAGVESEQRTEQSLEGEIAFRANEYDVAVLAYPWGQKTARTEGSKGISGFENLSSEVEYLKQTIKRVKHVVVCVVPKSWITKTSGDDVRLKEEIILDGLLKAVIQLPEKMLKDTPNAPALMLITKGHRNNDVRLISADNEEFCRRDGKGLVTVKNFRALIAEVERIVSSGVAYSVPKEVLSGQRFNLLPEKYIETWRLKKKVEAFFERAVSTKLLEDVATIIGCQAIPNKENELGEEIDGSLVKEIRPSSILDSGFRVDYSDANAFVPTTDQEAKVSKQTVQKGDILLCVKGPVGRCAYIHVLPKETVVANQAFVILRVKKSVLSAKVLFRYLISPMGQELIKASKTGVTVPIVKSIDLEFLSVPIPTKEQQSIIEKDYTEIAALFEAKNKIESQIESKIAQFWRSDSELD